MRTAFFLLFAVVLNFTIQAQGFNTLKIRLEGMELKGLTLVIIMDDENRTKIVKPGRTENGTDWIFTYPDSLYEKQTDVRIDFPVAVDSLSGSIGFVSIISEDTLRAASFCINRGLSEIQANYLRTIYYSSAIQHQFLVSSESDKQVLSSIEAVGYRYSFPDRRDSALYETQLDFFENMTRKYPDSRFFSYLLANTMALYKSKADINRIYSCFTDKIRQSNYGKKVNDFLASGDTWFEYDTFENTLLPVLHSNEIEPILKDTSLYNLVLFSASWCAPCREEIPILKQVYEQYGDRMILTYVSMDEEETVDGWSELMERETIPWRSLMTKDSLNVVRDRYFIQGIPHTLLVYPGGIRAEILDIRADENYRKMVSLVLKQ